MLFSSFYLFICLTSLFHNLQFSTAGNNETDRIALLEIKAKIRNDPLNILSSWNDSLHFCEWYGVTCGGKHKRATMLDLQSSKLTGTLSPFIGNLTFLMELDLGNNSFGGALPSEIGRLHRLQNLLLLNNTFGGRIPLNLSSCSSLKTLNLWNNEFAGEIPSEFGLLAQLQKLELTANNFAGLIPSSLGNLSSLSTFFSARNNLVGRVPEDLGKLKNLTVLALGFNNLSDVFPSSIFNLSRLTGLDLGFNDLEGHLPLDLGTTLQNISFFSTQRNRFSGSIPTSISNMSQLQVLEVGENNFQGQVPSLKNLVNLERFVLDTNFLGSGRTEDLDFVVSLANATMLEALEFGKNNFSGIIPTIICNFSTLIFLQFYNNDINGQIPICIENLKYLRSFEASNNRISGVIPKNLGKLQQVDQLHLDGNQLSGSIPTSIGNSTFLTSLDLSENNLEGQIPYSLGNCKYLLWLSLSFNNFTGRIPPEVLSLSSLSRLLDLSQNHLSGSLPEEVGQLRNLDVLDISGNQLSGELPSTLGSCIQLELLFMENNNFQGTIPDELKMLQSLHALDLSKNNLSGEVPEFLASLKLQVLNLSYNNFEGKVPGGGIFDNETGFSIAGNSRICGGTLELKLQRCKFGKTHIKKPSNKRRFVYALSFGLLGVALLLSLLVLLYSFWFRKRTKKPTASRDSENFPTLSYQTLMNATNGFCVDNLIGRGTFGVVYKASLNDQEDTMTVAVKVLNLEHHGASKSFMAECGVLRNIRHRNLVKVITACSSVDYQGNDFKALVYEYMVNGSLDDWLYPTEAITGLQGTDCAPRVLSFFQRLNIAVDIALALEYLHHHCGSSVVHCDLKPSNVLLDSDFVAHIGDFGLAKFLWKDTSYSHQSSSAGVRGTIGYTPPEYGLGNEVSTSGDVYSFGMLLLEMFTGKRPTDNAFCEGFSLCNFVEAALPDKLTAIVDHSLLGDIAQNETKNSAMSESLVSVLGIALSCSSELPQERLGMSVVTPQLSSIRNKFLGTCLPRQ